MGTGKSHLAAIIANEIIDRYQINVKFRNIPEIINEIEKGGFELDKNLFIQNLSNTPLLILDDFGIERRTSYTLEYLYQIINSRYKSKLPTIISTNIHVEEMKMKNIGFSMERIYSRILEMCVPILVFGENRREGKAETKNKFFYEMMKEEEND